MEVLVGLKGTSIKDRDSGCAPQLALTTTVLLHYISLQNKNHAFRFYQANWMRVWSTERIAIASRLTGPPGEVWCQLTDPEAMKNFVSLSGT